MEPIKNVNLFDLVKETSEQMIQERRKQAANLIKKELQRAEQLARDIKNLEKELNSKKSKLSTAQMRIDKIREGDWSLLIEDKSEKNN